MKTAPPEDPVRFDVPLYTLTEAAWYLGMSPKTMHYWARGRGRISPIISAQPTRGRTQPAIPFIGLAQAAVILAFRRASRIPMQYVRRALAAVEEDIGLQFALASKRLFMEGAKILVEWGRSDEGVRMLAEAVTRNYIFTGVVKSQLRLIEFASDGWASRLVLPATSHPVVQVDPHRASGQPLTLRGGARILDIVERFRGGESPESIAEDFGVPVEDVLDIIRAFYSPFPEAA